MNVTQGKGKGKSNNTTKEKKKKHMGLQGRSGRLDRNAYQGLLTLGW